MLLQKDRLINPQNLAFFLYAHMDQEDLYLPVKDTSAR